MCSLLRLSCLLTVKDYKFSSPKVAHNLTVQTSLPIMSLLEKCPNDRHSEIEGEFVQCICVHYKRHVFRQNAYIPLSRPPFFFIRIYLCQRHCGLSARPPLLYVDSKLRSSSYIYRPRHRKFLSSGVIEHASLGRPTQRESYPILCAHVKMPY